jgi:hypothetical protein
MKRAVPRVMQKVEASGAMRWLASLFKVRSFPDPSIKFMASRGGEPGGSGRK